MQKNILLIKTHFRQNNLDFGEKVQRLYKSLRKKREDTSLETILRYMAKYPVVNKNEIIDNLLLKWKKYYLKEFNQSDMYTLCALRKDLWITFIQYLAISNFPNESEYKLLDMYITAIDDTILRSIDLSCLDNLNSISLTNSGIDNDVNIEPSLKPEFHSENEQRHLTEANSHVKFSDQSNFGKHTFVAEPKENSPSNEKHFTFNLSKKTYSDSEFDSGSDVDLP